MNPTRMIRLPLHFGDNVWVKILEVRFLVVNVPTAYNVILGWLALHRVRPVIAPTCSNFNLKLMTVALVRCREISEWLTNATLLAFSHW